MLSFDDYHKGNDYIADIYKGLEKETIFFIDFNDKDSKSQIERLHKKGFQIGSHTLTHALLTRIPLEEAKYEIEESKAEIEMITGKCDWFCYPRGYYNEDIIKLVKEAGYKYARTTLFKDGKTLYEKGAFHLSYPREEYRGINPFQLARITKLNHYWGHAVEFERYNTWDLFEKFIKWYRDELPKTSNN